MSQKSNRTLASIGAVLVLLLAAGTAAVLLYHAQALDEDHRAALIAIETEAGGSAVGIFMSFKSAMEGGRLWVRPPTVPMIVLIYPVFHVQP